MMKINTIFIHSTFDKLIADSMKKLPPCFRVLHKAGLH